MGDDCVAFDLVEPNVFVIYSISHPTQFRVNIKLTSLQKTSNPVPFELLNETLDPKSSQKQLMYIFQSSRTSVSYPLPFIHMFQQRGLSAVHSYRDFSGLTPNFSYFEITKQQDFLFCIGLVVKEIWKQCSRVLRAIFIMWMI